MGRPRKRARKGSVPEPPASTLVLDQEAEAEPEDHSEEVLEFIRAIDDYRRANNRPFPTWSEVLTVVRSLGYRKPDAKS